MTDEERLQTCVPVEGHEDYLISPDGFIYSTKRNKFLKRQRGDRYELAQFWENGVCHNTPLHKVIARAFVPNPNPAVKDQVNHIDGNRWNNDISNLEWCTQSENMQHAFRMNLVPKPEVYYNARPVLMISEDYFVLREFKDAREAAQWIGMSYDSVYAACYHNPLQRMTGGYRWCFKDWLVPNGW